MDRLAFIVYRRRGRIKNGTSRSKGKFWRCLLIHLVRC